MRTATPVAAAMSGSCPGCANMAGDLRNRAWRGQNRSVGSRTCQLLQCWECENINDEAAVERLREAGADVMVVADFGQFIEGPRRSAVRVDAINLHGSLLPELRGAAPINWAIIRGYKRTGVTTFSLVGKMDAGDVYLQEAVEIDPAWTAGGTGAAGGGWGERRVPDAGFACGRAGGAGRAGSLQGDAGAAYEEERRRDRLVSGCDGDPQSHSRMLAVAWGSGGVYAGERAGGAGDHCSGGGC